MWKPTIAMVQHLIESREQLLAFFSEAYKPPEKWRVGGEFEKLGVDEETGRAVCYSGPHGIEEVLAACARESAWSPVYEADHILGLEEGESSVSLEPGGQVELSSAPWQSLHDMAAELSAHLNELKEASRDCGIAWLGIGIHPVSRWDEIELIPKERYAIMNRYMPRKGSTGLAMMRETASVQFNFDYQGEQDAMEKFRLSTALSPVLMALFANSAISGGQKNGFLSRRIHIWQHTDPERCGFIERLYRADGGFEEYVDYVLAVPMYFIVREGRWIEIGGALTFGQFLEKGFQGYGPAWDDWELHLSTVFTNVRFEPFLEIRGIDCPLPGLIMSAPALLKGILYDTQAREAVWSMVKSWTFLELEGLYEQVSRQGPRSRIGGHALIDLFPELVSIGREGLRRQSLTNEQGEDETIYLESLEALLEHGSGCPASEILESWEGEWSRDMRKLISSCRF